MPLLAIPEVLWPQILDAAGGDEAARPLLLGLGSSSTRLRGLAKLLLSFRLSAAASGADVPAIRASSLKIDGLCVVLGREDELAWGALDGIRRLHVVGGSGAWRHPGQQLLHVRELAVTDWRGDLDFLDAMPLLEELRIANLIGDQSTSPIARLLTLRVLTARYRVVRDMTHQGVVLRPDCTVVIWIP